MPDFLILIALVVFLLATEAPISYWLVSLAALWIKIGNTNGETKQ